MSQSDGTVVIIGAGIIGIACAHYLVAAGRKVIVLDKGSVAAGCSYGNCGHVIPSHILPLNTPDAVKAAVFSLFDPEAPFRVKPQFSPSFVRWMVNFALCCTNKRMLEGAAHLKSILDASFLEFEKLLATGGIDCNWSKSGLLYLFQTQREFDSFAKTNNMLSQRFNVAARAISGDELPSFDRAVKPGLAGGYFYEDDALLRPDLLALGWAEQLRAAGVEFVENCAVKSIEKEGSRIKRVIAGGREFVAEEFVIAAGAFTAEFASDLDCAIPVLPGKGYSVTLSRPDPCPKTSVVLPERNVAITPFADGLRIGSIMELVGFDDSIPPARVRQLKESAEDFFCATAPEGEDRAWFGWRPMSCDGLPIIGRAPTIRNAVIATGHGMLGVMLAPTTGRLVSEIIGEHMTHVPAAPFSPARFAA